MRLPAAYLHLVRVCNGGLFAPNIVQWVTGNVELEGIAPLDKLLDNYTTAHGEWGVPEWLIPLGGDGHGWVCLDYRAPATRTTGENVPVVSCYQDDDPEWEPRQHAPNFEAFLKFMKNLQPPGEGSGSDNEED